MVSSSSALSLRALLEAGLGEPKLFADAFEGRLTRFGRASDVAKGADRKGERCGHLRRDARPLPFLAKLLSNRFVAEPRKGSVGASERGSNRIATGRFVRHL